MALAGIETAVTDPAAPLVVTLGAEAWGALSRTTGGLDRNRTMFGAGPVVSAAWQPIRRGPTLALSLHAQALVSHISGDDLTIQVEEDAAPGGHLNENRTGSELGGGFGGGLALRQHAGRNAVATLRVIALREAMYGDPSSWLSRVELGVMWRP
jgi:hypothetical protein